MSSANIGRDIFSIQLEVTAKLLEAETRKLKLLKDDLLGMTSSSNESYLITREIDRRQTSLRHLLTQHDQLASEYREAAEGMLRRSVSSRRSSRSHPALGIRQTIKSRPSIFGNLTPISTPGENSRVKHDKNGSLSRNGHAPIDNKKDAFESRHTEHDKWSGISEELVYDGNHLVAGTLTALIKKLVPTDEYYPERTFVFAFLLCSRVFILPYQLLAKVSQACANSMTENPGKALMVAANLVKLISEWVDTFPYDFRDERMMRQLRDVTQFCTRLSPEFRGPVGHITHSLVQKLSALSKYEDVLIKMDSMTGKPHNGDRIGIIDVCPEPDQLARQLTLVEMERFSCIGPEEFIQAFITNSCSVKLPQEQEIKRTSNLEAYVEWFNRLSYLVATEVCSEKMKRQRVKVVEYFVEVARHCYNIGNFNSLMAIIAGLNVNCVKRLRKTWSKVRTSKFEFLEHQMNPDSNFAKYRRRLKDGMTETKKTFDCIVPFFTLLVKDIYFVNEGLKNRLENGFINFEKFWQLSKQVTEIISLRTEQCTFEKIRIVLNFLVTATVQSEDELYLMSFDCEPAETKYEKDKLASIRSNMVTFKESDVEHTTI